MTGFRRVIVKIVSVSLFPRLFGLLIYLLLIKTRPREASPIGSCRQQRRERARLVCAAHGFNATAPGTGCGGEPPAATPGHPAATAGLPHAQRVQADLLSCCHGNRDSPRLRQHFNGVHAKVYLYVGTSSEAVSPGAAAHGSRCSVRTVNIK